MQALLERLNLTTLSTREKSLLGLGLAAAVVFIGTLSGLWFHNRLLERERRIEQKQAGMAEIAELATKYRHAEDKRKELEKRMKNNKVNLFKELDEVARRRGITLTQIEEKLAPARSGKGGRNDNVREEMVQVKITKTDLGGLVQFLEDIENRKRLVVVRSLVLKKRYDDNKRVDAKFQVATFKKKKG